MANTKNEDPNPGKFRIEFIISAIILVVLGILVFVFASVIAGAIITLLGAIFGLGSQVVKNLPAE